jgi:hypothetical protein
LSFAPSPAKAGEGWGEGLLSEEQKLPSSAFGTFSRKREKGKKRHFSEREKGKKKTAAHGVRSVATETVASEARQLRGRNRTGKVTESGKTKNQQ